MAIKSIVFNPDDNGKTLKQIKTKIEEATNFFASGDPIDWNDVKYICNVVLELIKRIEQLEHERNINPIINGDLISRKALQVTFYDKCRTECVVCEYANEYYDGCGLIDAAPAVDAEPVRHGHWEPMVVSSGRDSWKCSECGRRARGKLKNLPYCHCGAKMDGDMKE